jgi:hypothetical protein
MMIPIDSTAANRTTRFRIHGAFAAMALSLAACAGKDSDDAERFTSVGGGATTDDSAGAQVIATLKTADGASLQFINESAGEQEPSIGVEIANSTTTPMTDALLAQQPSALELYLALSPGAVAPRALLRDHELLSESLGDADAPPRRLVVSAFDSETVTTGYNCQNSAGWAADFQAWAPVLDGQYIAANESGYTTGYVGYAPKFYFDVCRPLDTIAGLGPYYTAVQRRSNSAAAWSTISNNTDALNFQQRRWRYYRNTFTCSSFQYRLVVSSGTRLYHRAARWSDEFSCQIGG